MNNFNKEQELILNGNTYFVYYDTERDSTGTYSKVDVVFDEKGDELFLSDEEIKEIEAKLDENLNDESNEYDLYDEDELEKYFDCQD